MIVGKDVCKSFEGFKALDNASFHVRKGSVYGLVGPNGAGKTTFIKLLCRLYDPTEGQILLNGIDIKKYDYQEYQSLFSVVFQDFKLFSFELGQNVAASVDYEEERVWDSLDKAGIGDRVRRMKEGLQTVLYQAGDDGVEISGGEAQKIAIARALYKDAPVIILDEPTRGIDAGARTDVYNIIKGLSKKGLAVLLISSDMEEIIELSDRAVTIHQGRLNCEFDRADINQENLTKASFGVIGKEKES